MYPRGYNEEEKWNKKKSEKNLNIVAISETAQANMLLIAILLPLAPFMRLT